MPELFHQRLLRATSYHAPYLEGLALALLRLGRPTIEGPPYHMPGFSAPPIGGMKADGPIFITARYRSGSTLLWQLFERLDGFTAYYEPLNEQRWFSGQQRRDTDTTHRGVSNYGANYEGLEKLEVYFTEDWTYKHLAMGQGSRDDKMVAYITALIQAAKTRPVLQFNRLDFRLPFIRAQFPEASIVHIERNARDIWRSALKGAANDRTWTLRGFEAQSDFYLLPYYRDLMLSFPWLRQQGHAHPYLVHYLIWRLSSLYASTWADYSLSYETLCEHFMDSAAGLLNALGHPHADLTMLDGLMEKRPSPYDHRADNSLYSELEAQAETILQENLSKGGAI